MAVERTSETATTPDSQAPAEVQPVVAPTPAQKSNKTLIIILVAVAVVVVAGIVAALMLMKPNYKESYDKTSALRSELMDWQENSGCRSFFDNLGEKDVTLEALNGYGDECDKEIKDFGDQLRAVGKTSGVQRDKEIKAQYDLVEMKWNALVSNEADFKKDLQANLDLHQFIIAADGVDGSDLDGMLEAVTYLTNSDNAKIKEVGDKFADYIKKLQRLMAELQAAKTPSEQTRIYKELQEVVDEMSELSDADEWSDGVVNFSADNLEAWADEFDRLNTMLKEKAE